MPMISKIDVLVGLFDPENAGLSRYQMVLTYACIDLERGQRSILDWGFMLSICSLRASLSMAGPSVTALLCPCVS